jgi:hypothetical protein
MSESDSKSLRETFYSCKEQISDGWEILGYGDRGGCYETDAVWYLKGPDGKLYEQSASCCSCYGIDDQWNPVETNTVTMLAQYEKLIAGQPKDDIYLDERDRGLKDALIELGVLEDDSVRSKDS